MKKILFALSVMVLFAACKEEEPVLPQNPEPDQETPEVITLKLTESEVTIVAGETHQLALEAALPEGVAVIWKSENADIATVDNNGFVTAVSEGTTNVSVELSDGSSKAVCAVTVELVVLNNQYALNNDVHSIGSVIELKSLEAGYRLALYEQEGVTNTDATPTMELFVATEKMGETLNLAQVTDDIATVSFNGQQYAFTSGTLKISKRNSIQLGGDAVTVVLDAECELGRLRANYTGLFAVVERYEGSNTLVVNNSEFSIATMLRNPAELGERIGFAFGNIEATSAEDYLEAKYAVWVDVSQSAIGRTIDMTTEKEYYTFTFFDYGNENIYDATNVRIKEGTITTHQVADGRVYLALNVTLDKGEGITITAEYFGAVTDVESLDAMVPNYNKYILYDNSGNATVTKQITQLQLQNVVATDRDTIYFVSADEVPGSYLNPCPMLIVSNELINAGEINCSDSENASLFKLKYKTISLGLQGGSSVYTPTNGILSISKDENNNYTINLDIVNKYISPYSSGEQGDNYRLKIRYQGVATKK